MRLPRTLKEIGVAAFYNSKIISRLIIPTSVEQITFVFGHAATGVYAEYYANVYYEGSKSEWDARFVQPDNPKAFGLYFYSESEPVETWDYWHYVNGEPEIWQKAN